jgi:hypothetical protein
MRTFLALGLVLALALLLGVRMAPAAAKAAFSGVRTVMILDQAREVHLCNIHLEDKDGKVNVRLGEMLANFKGSTIDNVSADDKALHFTLKRGPVEFRFTLFAAEKDKPLKGSVTFNGQVLLVIAETGEDKAIADADAVKPTPGADDLLHAAREKDAKKQVEELKQIIEKNAGKPIEFLASTSLVLAEVKAEAPADTIKKTVTKALEFAAAYGAEVESQAQVDITRALLQGKDSDLALEIARKVGESVKESDSPQVAMPRLKVLAAALHKAKKDEDAKLVDARIAKVEEKLDHEFEKTAIPFEPKPYAGRKEKSNRVAVVELFTGAQCPPCVSADVAFDAVLKAYKPADVALLQYHLHIPGPDPLTNAATEARAEYYSKDVQGTPTTFVNGQVTEGLGGFKQHGKERFDTLSGLLNKALEKAPGAQVKLTVERTGDELQLAAAVDDLEKPGDKVRLRFVLVEEVVRYQGRNGQRLHHHVVRDFPGGVDGFVLKEKSTKQTAKVSLGDLRKRLTEYLDSSAKRQRFMDDERPLNLDHLVVVALVQNDNDKEILQAAQAEVPAK